MRVESVRIMAFGPLVDQTLELAPGFTVVVGENESAKSTWHAAIYAGLCGLGRSRGRPSTDVADFIERRQPWDRPDQWEVLAVVRLDDGRRIEVRQNLANPAASRATDLAVGQDVSSQILTLQVPDAARYAGLDRQSFLATACIHQAKLLSVLEHSNDLQPALEQAASTAGTGGTAAEALDRLASYLGDHVGRRDDQRSRNRPLPRALEEVATARRRLGEAQSDHAAYLQEVADKDRLQAEAARAARAVALCEAAVAAKHADNLARRYQQASELVADFPEGQPDAIGNDETAEAVATALAAWHARETPPVLTGDSAAQLQDQLDALPPAPAGDLAPDPSVEDADRRLAAACHTLDQERRSEPPPPPDRLPDLDPDELTDLAHRLVGTTPVVGVSDTAVAEAAAEAARRQAATRRGDVLVAVGVVVVVLGLVAGLVGPKAVLAAVLLGVVIAAVGLATRRGGALSAAKEQHLELVGRLRAQQESAAAQAGTRQTAAQRCSQLGVDPDPERLRALVAELHRHNTYGASHRQWQERMAAYQQAVTKARQALVEALTARGVADLSDPDAALAAYQAACAQRHAQADAAGRRDALERQLAARKEAEELADSRLERNARASAEVCRLAHELGAGELDASVAVEALVAWQNQLRQRRAETEQRATKWDELNGLLSGGTLQDLADRAAAAATTAATTAEDLDPGEIAALAAGDPAAELASRRTDAEGARMAAVRAADRLDNWEIRSVPEAEEALAAAENRVAQLEALERTLRTTHTFLAEADEQVGRQLAPQLAAKVAAWLPAITGYRYVDAIVDPDSLEVKVCGANGLWRKAKYLSQGTAEQIYLLLRVGLVEFLTAGRDVCPLLLDDVTVQADSKRTVAILELLHQLSAERQIVLFAQEPAVADWARSALSEPANRLIELAVVGGT
ncbi:MAG: AAA family ATPase [Acidimicrobiales bacterium]